MNALIIQESKGTPRVELNPSGELIIEGRSLPFDPVKFYLPILEWVQECTCENIHVKFDLEYINTSSSKQVFLFLRSLKENPNIKNIQINWHFEEGDEDSYDAGREFETLIKIPFNFYEYAEIED